MRFCMMRRGWFFFKESGYSWPSLSRFIRLIADVGLLREFRLLHHCLKQCHFTQSLMADHYGILPWRCPSHRIFAVYQKWFFYIGTNILCRWRYPHRRATKQASYSYFFQPSAYLLVFICVFPLSKKAPWILKSRMPWFVTLYRTPYEARECILCSAVNHQK